VGGSSPETLAAIDDASRNIGAYADRLIAQIAQ